MTTEVLIVAVTVMVLAAAVGLGLTIRGIFRAIGGIQGQVMRLQRDNDDLWVKVGDLERSQVKRLPHDKAAGIEDALSVLWDVARQIEEQELENQVIQLRAQKAVGILQKVRGGEEYDMEAPCGKRLKREDVMREKTADDHRFRDDADLKKEEKTVARKGPGGNFTSYT